MTLIRQQARSSAFVLVGVLIVVLLVSMIALSVLFRMRSDETAAATGSSGEQAWASALSGVRIAMKIAASIRPGDTDWQDAPDRFKDQLLYEDGSEEWHWTLFTSDGEGGIRFGLSDESSKINLNTAANSLVARLPSMKASLTDALLDFLDADDLPRPEGAEQEYYDALPQPYRILNGPLATVEQLLLIRGFTPSIVFGEDANRNFTLDANEDDGDEHTPPDNNDGKLSLGLKPFLTVYSKEFNRDSRGVARIRLNATTNSLSETNGLPPAFVAFLAELQASDSVILHSSDLLETSVRLKDRNGQNREVPTGVGRDSLALVLDQFTGSDPSEIQGRININTASITVLQTIPGIDPSLAETIVSARAALPAERRQSIAWLYVENLVEADKFREIAPSLTSRGFQFSFNVVGFGVRSGHFRVLQAVIDVNEPTPKLLYLRDLTRLGLPFPIQSEENDPSDSNASPPLSSNQTASPKASTPNRRSRRGLSNFSLKLNRRRKRFCDEIFPRILPSRVGEKHQSRAVSF